MSLDHFLRREASIVITKERGSDKVQSTVMHVQCKHCGKHFPPNKDMGFCRQCNGFYCGARCQTCQSLEQWLENVEGGKAENHKPLRVPVAVPAGFDWSK